MSQDRKIFEFGDTHFDITEFPLHDFLNEIHFERKIKNPDQLKQRLNWIRDAIYRYEFLEVYDGQEVVEMLQILLWIERLFTVNAKSVNDQDN